MSVQIRWVHPDIKLRAPDPDVAPRPAPVPVQQPDEKPFSFEKLPWQVQWRILKSVLYKDGHLIHCISRLDPFVPPANFPSAQELGDKRSGLINTFFWGKRECSITQDGLKPNEVLACLMVSKRWYWLGVHIFYGLNTFAFSSLGEFGRFCQGSGLARIARMQHVELLFTGNQYLTAVDERKRVPFSRRTYALSWLTGMPRLKTLAIHINETGNMYTRRNWENPGIKQFMIGKTAGQPNVRMLRSMRCVQGMDYIHNLRGLDWIRFYDFNRALQHHDRVPIKDWSFVEDITNTSTLPKVPSRMERCQLHNLQPLFEGEQNWTPGADDWEMVKTTYLPSNGRCSYDDMRLQGYYHDADMASYLSIVNSPDSEDANSGNSEDSSPDSDSDSSTYWDSNSDTSDLMHSESDSDSDADAQSPQSPEHAPRLQRRSSSPLFVDLTSVPDESDHTDDSSLSTSSSSSTSSSCSSSDEDDDGDDEVDFSEDHFQSPSYSRSASRSRSRNRTPRPRSVAQLITDYAGYYNASANTTIDGRSPTASEGLFVTPGPRIKREGPDEAGMVVGRDGRPARPESMLRGDVVGLTTDEDNDGDDEDSSSAEQQEEEDSDDSEESEEDDSEDDDDSDDEDGENDEDGQGEGHDNEHGRSIRREESYNNDPNPPANNDASNHSIYCPARDEQSPTRSTSLPGARPAAVSSGRNLKRSGSFSLLREGPSEQKRLRVARSTAW
ncbi:hypothetical protein VTK26DRAFT_6983 [Humicola hyalothermophila]